MLDSTLFDLSPEEFRLLREIMVDPKRRQAVYHILELELMKEADQFEGQQRRRTLLDTIQS